MAWPPDAHANFAISSVATAPSPATSGTSLVVAAGEGARFPAVPFNAVVCPNAVPTPANAEVVRVTARTTDTLTISRAQEGSVARAIVAGDKIFAAITAKTLTDVEGQLTTLGDALTYKGAIDCSANPNYPAANAGDTYKVSVAGKIGGASGVNVEVGDALICTVDGSAAGTQAAVGANWDILQVNIDGAVIGPASAVNGNIPQFSGTTGKLLSDSGKAPAAASGLATLDGSSKVVQARPDQTILARELADLARTGGWLPSGAIAETFPRHLCMNTLGLVSGRLQLGGGIVIPGGRTVTSISVFAHSTGATTPTNQWFCLVDRSGNVLAKTVDDTTTAWAGNTVKTLNLSSTYTPTNAIEVYVGVVVVAATPPSLSRPGSAPGSAIGSGGGFGDSANTGLTNPASLGATVSGVPPGQSAFYAYIS